MDAEELFALIESHSAAIKKLHSEASSINSEILSLQEKHKEAENKEQSQEEINEAIKRRQAVLEQFVEHATERAELQKQADPARNSPRPNEDIAALRIRAAQADLKAKREARAKPPETEETAPEAPAIPGGVSPPSPPVTSAPIPPLPPPPPPSLSSVLAPDLSAVTKAKSAGGKQHFDVTGKDATGAVKTVSVTTAKNREDARRTARLHGLSGALVAERNRKSERAAARAERTGASTPTGTGPTGAEAAPAGGSPPSSPGAPHGGGSSSPPLSPPSSGGGVVQVHDAQMFVLVTKIQERIEKAKTEDDKKEGEAKREDDTKGKTTTGKKGKPTTPSRTYGKLHKGSIYSKARREERLERRFGTKAPKRNPLRRVALRRGKKAIKRIAEKAPSTPGGLAGATGVELANFAGPIGEFAVAVAAFGVAAYEFARHEEKEIRRLSEYGAGQAIGIGTLDAHRQLRDAKTAGETGGSAQDLTAAIDKLEDALQPIISLLTNITNETLAPILEVLTLLLNANRPLVEVLNAILRYFTGSREKLAVNWDLIEKAAERERGRDRRWP